MKVSSFSGSPLAESASAAVILLPQAAKAPDWLSSSPLHAAIERLMDRGEFAAKPNETLTLWDQAGVAAPLILLTGLGKPEAIDARVISRACGTAARQLAAKPREKVLLAPATDWSDDSWTYAIAGAMVGSQGTDLYRAERVRHPFGELLCYGASSAAVRRGPTLGESINLARRLVNEPPQNMYPETFADECRRLASAYALEFESWDEDRLERERAGSLLAVARGSTRPPRLVILRHHGGAPGDPWLALVGKGVTFDSGGLSLKPTPSMLTMKCDMSGAASVVATIVAAAREKLPINIMALAGLVENMPGPQAVKLGDVLTARNGRTIEVHNTDAEGRLVLADVLSVAVDLGAARLVDVATLTGACVVALGSTVAGLFSNDDHWYDEVALAAKSAGEPVWRLPLFDEFAEHIKSDIADIKNVGDGRNAGAIAAAKFLESFVDGKPWAHFDIAGPAFLEKGVGWQDSGATGVPVRTLVELTRRLAAE